MPQAIFNDTVIADSSQTVVVEGNHYFPPDSVRSEFLVDSPTTSTCPWKGQAAYKTVRVDGQEVPDGAWYYPQPSDAARQITGHYAFWKGVRVTN